MSDTMPARRSAVRVLAALAVAAALITACGGDATDPEAGGTQPTGTSAQSPTGSPSETASPTPTVPADIDGCVTAADGELLHYEGASTTSDVAVMGDGPSAVIISYEVHGRVCDWLPLAGPLVDAGHTVIVYDRRSGSPDDFPIDLTTFARERGLDPVILVGGSLGGMASITAGATITPPVAAVVSMSGADGDSVTEAATLKVPLLQIVAAEDEPFTSSARQVDAAAVNSPDHQLVVLDGRMHASWFFSSLNSDEIVAQVVDFVNKYAPVGATP